MFDFFPSELEQEVSIVLKCIPKTTFGNSTIGITEETTEYKLNEETIIIPYRIHFTEPLESEIYKLTDLQKQILYCIYTRSCNGFLREKYLHKLLKTNFKEWCIPYIVKLCDEYVVEILYDIYNSLNERNNEDIRAFCRVNNAVIRRGYSRMISYWNEYYRAEIYRFHEYIGERLFRECLGYDREDI